jgi:hypothetical protein
MSETFDSLLDLGKVAFTEGGLTISLRVEHDSEVPSKDLLGLSGFACTTI